MADTNPIKIFKGDDTDFNGGKWLTINLTTDLDLTGFIGVFTLDKFKVTKSAASKSIDLVIPRSFTSKMAVGEYAGIFQLIDTNGRYLTVTNTIPFQVTQEVFTPQGDEINLQVPENYPVEISLSVSGGAVDYDKLANLPTFNGKEWKGPLTFASENIAPKSELDALAGKVNTNKNDIDGLGDQIHEVEAKIPQAASDSNQLVDKASMTSAIAAVQKGVDDNAGDIAALSADLAGKQDKGDYATNTALTAGLQTKQNAFTVGDGLKMEDNVLSATGGNAYTQSNLLAGNNITIDEVLPEGGIDNHTLACWHFDEGLEPIKFDSQLTSDVRGTIEHDYYKFGNGSCSGPNITIMNRGLNTSDFTVDYFFMPKDYIGGKRTYIGDVSIYINGLGFIVYFNNNKIYEFSIEQYGIWTHFAIQRKDLIYTIYVNGQSVFQSTEALTTRPATLFEALTGGSIYFYIDELRISDIARQLNPDGKFPVPTQPYSVAEPTGKVAINNAITKTSQLTNDSGFLTSVPENLVTTDTAQVISESKEFTRFIRLNAGAQVSSLSTTDNRTLFVMSGSSLFFNDYTQDANWKASEFNIITQNPNTAVVGPATLNGKQIATMDDITAAVAKVQGLKKTVADLATGADSAAIIAKVNEILAALREAGVLS